MTLVMFYSKSLYLLEQFCNSWFLFFSKLEFVEMVNKMDVPGSLLCRLI